MGEFPVAAVAMLASIAAETEPHRTPWESKSCLKTYGQGGNISVVDIITLCVEHAMQHTTPVALIVPTVSGAAARKIARFRLPVWVTVFTPDSSTSQSLQFTYGVNPVNVEQDLEDWN